MSFFRVSSLDVFCQKAVHKNSTNSQENNCDGILFSKGLQPKTYSKRTQLRILDRDPEQPFRMETLPLSALPGEY